MIPSHSPQQAAIARQLQQQLQAYDAGVRELLERRWDPELYRSLSDQFDRMQMLASALPRVSVSWTELLISRAELMHAVWTLRAPSRINGKVVALQAQHSVLVQEVARRCRAYLPAAERGAFAGPAGAAADALPTSRSS